MLVKWILAVSFNINICDIDHHLEKIKMCDKYGSLLSCNISIFKTSLMCILCVAIKWNILSLFFHPSWHMFVEPYWAAKVSFVSNFVICNGESLISELMPICAKM